MQRFMYRTPLLLLTVLLCAGHCSEQDTGSPEKPSFSERPENQKPGVSYSDPALQKVYETLTETNWSGQLDSGSYFGLSIFGKKVGMTYPGTRHGIDGTLHLEPGIIKIRFSGRTIFAPGVNERYQYDITGRCHIAREDLPYQYQVYLECHWVKDCENPVMLVCSMLPDSLRWFDPKSHKPAGQSTVIDGTEIVTLGLQDATTKEDVFIRLGPSVTADHAMDLLQCGHANDTLDRYEEGNSFTLIGRTLEKSEVLGSFDYWYYGVYGASDCASGWAGKGWIFGSLLK